LGFSIHGSGFKGQDINLLLVFESKGISTLGFQFQIVADLLDSGNTMSEERIHIHPPLPLMGGEVDEVV